MQVFQKRNLFVMGLLLFVTGGLYFFYWLYQTKKEINQYGAQIPSLWFAVLPFFNIYFDYRYARDYVKYALQQEDTNKVILYFLLIFILPVVAPLVIQYELNNYTAY